jgi:hypothetical protein
MYKAAFGRFLGIRHSKVPVRVRVLQHNWKLKGSRFEQEGKVIAGKTNGI